LISKRRVGKLYALDAIIMSLKENSDFSEDNYLVIVLTGKAALAINNSTLHSMKNRLSLPI